MYAKQMIGNVIKIGSSVRKSDAMSRNHGIPNIQKRKDEYQTLILLVNSAVETGHQSHPTSDRV